MQDPILKRIFAIPGMIELLARRCRPDLASTVNFATLAELPNELVQPEAIEPWAARAEDVPVLVLGLLVPGQTPAEQRRRIDALKRALEPAADPRLRERLGRELRPVLVSTYDHPLLKETSSMATMIEIFAQVRDEGLASARNEGRLEGRTRMIRMIVRQARRRFGPETARRLSRLLAGADDPDRLDGVAEAVIDCDGGGEFLDRVGALLRADQS